MHDRQPRGPVARTDDIIVTEADGETLVYDLRTHQAHVLDATATRLWRLCDGSRDLATLADDVHRQLADDGHALGADDDARRDAISYCIARLARADLIVAAPEGAARIGRRALLRRAAAAGLSTIALPTILSVLAPTSLQAQGSCVPNGVPCVQGFLPCCTAGFACKRLPGGGGLFICR